MNNSNWILLDGHKNISYCESEKDIRFPEKHLLIPVSCPRLRLSYAR
jgi:hypothetical protein